MPRVVPSQVVAFIDEAFSWARRQKEDSGDRVTLSQSDALAALLELLDRLPDNTLTLNSSDYSNYVVSVAAIRDQIEHWRAHGEAKRAALKTVSGLPRLNPVTLIRRALATCPDEGPVPTTSGLVFITDNDLRLALCTDIGSIETALANGEWKAATVLSGSVVEALLLWALNQKLPAEITSAVTAVVRSKAIHKDPPKDLNEWSLHHYIEVAAHLRLIESETADQTRLAQDFRNLIHPGRSQRLQQKCDRATAYSAVAAVHHTVRDLS